MKGAGLERLAAFLAARPPEVRVVTLRFASVEEVLQGPLPAPARLRRGWWVARRPWDPSGWRVARVDLATGLVEFERRAS